MTRITGVAVQPGAVAVLEASAESLADMIVATAGMGDNEQHIDAALNWMRRRMIERAAVAFDSLQLA